MSVLENKKVACLITGASQSIGAALAKLLASKVADGSTFILSSRSKSRVEQVVKAIARPGVHVCAVEWKLGEDKALKYGEDLKKCLTASYDVGLVVHNAYDMGDLSKRCLDYTDETELNRLLNANVTSMACINAYFLNTVNAKTKIVVHFSAPSVFQPFASLGVAAGARAARKMILDVLHVENPEIKVLHVTPGLVDSEGLRSLRDASHDKGIRDWVASAYSKGDLLAPEQIAARVYHLVDGDRYKSTEQIDLPNINV